MLNNRKKGIVRNIDPLGRLVIPKEIRRELGWHETDPVEMSVEGDTVVIRKHQNSCILCGHNKEDDLIETMGKKVCKKCICQLKRL